MVRRTLAAAGAALGLFHAWLLVAQLADGRLADPSAVARWAVAGGLVWGLFLIRRQGSSMLWGRRATSLWLLAALLHAPAVANRLNNSPSGFDLPAAVVALVDVTLGAGIVFATLIAFRRRRFHPPVTATWTTSACVAFRALAAGEYLTLSPRPPPIS